ncbi:VWA domain-containing protein [Streptomyces sp. MMS21 TC-5]|uniref:VWA domain-containing protein n=1 Tax=Streptomyces sp. MMS21 TC-5 TaxID=2925833 RepID=UPI001F615FD8|nr:VWA domain-containing protein [Streptomyces sp. MMS21 TC-5]MCI4078795.1 VWA domain-containing protein [Streptomyces sp. MMS21 TC-5]
MSLRKGENAALLTARVVLSVAVQGLSADVSALLLGLDGRVRGDHDLVFYNHPVQDGVSVAGAAVTAELSRLPADVHRVVIVASADPLQPGAVFTRAPQLTITQSGAPAMSFTAPDFTSGETVVVLTELYRRGADWKVRAVGQGYASGLAGLATDYGVDVDPEPTGVPLPTQTRTTPAVAAVDLTKLERQAPALLAPARQAGQALADRGITGRHAAVYLILDHDWHMEELYESFAVQAFAERVLALSANLDDDGTVPVIFSSGREPFLEEIRLDNYRGRIGQLHTQVDWGWGSVSDAMRRAVSHYQESGATDPAFIVTQVGDEPYDKAEVRSLLQNTASLGIFWLFVGFGRGKLAFYKNLNASTSATFPNVAFYDASKNPGAVPGERFYTGLVDSFARWMRS